MTSTHTNTEAVSDERLAEFLLDYAKRAGAIGIPGSIVPILTKAGEALSRRSASNTGGVEVKALVWEEDEPGWWCAQPAAMIGGFGYEVRITDSGNVRARRGRDDWAAFEGTLEQAKAAAQADFNQRILSAISLAAEAEPVAYSEAETWCRLTGKALDALDAISCWEVEQDDEDAAGQMAEFAEKATVEIRAAYPQVPHPSSSVSAEVTVTDAHVEIALDEYRRRVREYDADFNRLDRSDEGFWERKYGTNLHSTGLGERRAMQFAINAALASINGGRENG